MNAYDVLADRLRELARGEAVEVAPEIERWKVIAIDPLAVEQLDGSMILEDGDPDFDVEEGVRQYAKTYGIRVGDLIVVDRAGDEWIARGIVTGRPPVTPATVEELSGHIEQTTTAHGGIVASTDPRLANARPPIPHAATHATGGDDALAPADIGAAATGDTRFPTAAQKLALAGTNGAPGNANRYVTETDPILGAASPPSGAAGGDLGSNYPNPTVVKAQAGFKVGGVFAVLTDDARLADSRAPSGAAGGDLAGNYPNPTVKKHSGGTIGFFGTAAVARTAAYTQTYATADRVLAAYAANAQNAAYVGAADGEAKLADLNALRVAYENLRAFVEDLAQHHNAILDDLQAYGLLQ